MHPVLVALAKDNLVREAIKLVGVKVFEAGIQYSETNKVKTKMTATKKINFYDIFVDMAAREIIRKENK